MTLFAQIRPEIKALALALAYSHTSRQTVDADAGFFLSSVGFFLASDLFSAEELLRPPEWFGSCDLLTGLNPCISGSLLQICGD